MQTKLRIFFTLSLAALLTSCGFHLRNQAIVPAQDKILYVSSNTPYALSVLPIKQILSNFGVQVVEPPQHAPYTLLILDQTQTQQLLSSSTNNQLQTYQLQYSLHYQLLDQNGRIVIPTRSVSVIRNFTSNPNQALSQHYEQNLLLEDMQHDAVEQLLYQLNSNRK